MKFDLKTLILLAFKFIYMNSEIIISSALISLFLLALIGVKRSKISINKFISFLYLSLSCVMLKDFVQPTENNFAFVGIITFVCGINFFLSQLFSEKKIRWIFPVLSIILFGIFAKNPFTFNEYSIDFTEKTVILVIVLGFLSGLISELVAQLFKKFIPDEKRPAFKQFVQATSIALFVIPASFFVSWFGFVLLALGYFLWMCYDKSAKSGTLLFLLSFSIAYVFIQRYELVSIDLNIGKVVAGLMLGLAICFASSILTYFTNQLAKISIVALLLMLVAMLSLLNHIHPAYGGASSFVAVLLGFGVGNVIYSNPMAFIYFPILLLIGTYFPSDPFKKAESEVKTSQQTNETPKAVIQPVEGVSLVGVEGKFQVVDSLSSIAFQLGPAGGVTKGAFNLFEGEVTFNAQLEKSEFNITLYTKELTTFNSIRDKSLMAEDYLNESKFPMMQFQSATLQADGDHYVIEGVFNMLGKSHQEKVSLKYLGKTGSQHRFIGKGSINRIDYGMASAPSEGNIIDFTFEMVVQS